MSVSNKVSLYREKMRQRGRKKGRDMGGRDLETEKREKSGEMKCRGQRRDAWRRGRKALELACSGGWGVGSGGHRFPCCFNRDGKTESVPGQVLLL